MLTLKQLLEVAKALELPDDTPICLPYDCTNVNSIDINVNVISVLDSEHAHGKKHRITFATSQKYHPNEATLRLLVGKNQWREFKLTKG